MRRIFLSLAVLICIVAIAQEKEKRVALIIGNDKYSGYFSPLFTCINDVDAMSNVLLKLGFDTIVGRNLSRDSMKTYLSEFSKRANGAKLALFYYSGHAGIDNKENYYLAPSGNYSSAATLTEDCFSFSTVENVIKKIGVPVKFLIVDACRNSIDDNKGKMPNFSPEVINKSLTKAKGTINWFSTGMNKPAKSGDGKYSLFTASLLNHIGDYDNLGKIFNRISDEVTKANPDQVPYSHDSADSLSSKICLNPNKVRLYPINQEGKDYYSITTIPSDATISVNGTIFKSGDTFLLNYGTDYNITISAKGYSTYNKTITATPVKTLYKISLDTLAKASVYVESNRKKAIVYFDGERVGNFPIDTYVGIHDIRVECSGYSIYHSRPDLKRGSQRIPVHLYRQYPWFWSWDDCDSPAGSASYIYSRKYQIGLEYLQKIVNESRVLLGGYIGFSPGFIKTLVNSFGVCAEAHSEASAIDGNMVVEATYDANLLILPTLGYQLNNGLQIEAGVGTAAHWDGCKYNTGNETHKTHWSKPNWSPAMRLGFKTFIPLNNDKEWFISIGSGYTYLFSNKDYSSWDVSIGGAWSL